MDKRRLEAFSDGVFAIVITLLVLELKLPAVTYDALGRSLVQLLPSISAYALSFLLIGMYWVYHHHAYTFIDGVDGVLLWLNIVFLLLISFMPFPTMMLGRYPGQTLPVVFYGCNLLLANLHGLAMLLYLKRAPQLASRLFTPALFRRQVTVYVVVNSLYLANIGLAFVLPRVAMTNRCARHNSTTGSRVMRAGTPRRAGPGGAAAAPSAPRPVPPRRARAATAAHNSG